MDTKLKLPILLLLTIFVSQCLTDKDKVQYEPVDNACQKCTCLTAKDENKSKHYVLSCSVKNLNYILAGWPEEFGTNHTGIEIVVSFSGNPIQKLHQLPETEAIVSFSCRHCNITEIGSAIFMDVVNIQRVDLSWNEITGDELRADVFRGRYNIREYEPIALEDLDLNHNRIHTLERRIFEHTPYLKKLNLANNEFDLIDLTTASALASIKEVKHLDLSFNKLKTLPDNLFKTLTQLRHLHIEGNQLTTIPTCLSLVGASLKSLYIGANLIEAIREDSFVGYKQLTHLNVSGMTTLKSVDAGTFAHINTLEVVIFKDNPNLNKFDIDSLKDAKNLRDLDLSNCALNKLNMVYEVEKTAMQNDTKNWISLRTIHLNGNPWNCDCLMSHMLQDLLEYNNAKNYSDFKARCTTPYDMSGILLQDLTIELACQLPTMHMQIVAEPEAHHFLRPNAIVLTIVASVVILSIALIVGFGIALIRRKLKKDSFIFITPIRYTTVRNSTMSTRSTVSTMVAD